MNIDNDQVNWDRLSAYVAGDVTPGERDVIDRWLQADPIRMVTVDKLRLLWLARQSPMAPDFDLASSKASVFHAIGRPMASGDRREIPGLGRGRLLVLQRTMYTVIGSVAVAVCVLIGTGWLRTSNVVRSGVASQPFTYATANGERAAITLPDGSSVVLNVASRLDVPSDYAAGNRVVTLDGEARFTVVHQDDAPFVVKAGPSTTRVLGTTFMVRHYANDTNAVIAVEDGKVSVQSTVLTAKQQIEVTPNGVMALRELTADEFSVASRILTLNDMPIADAIVSLNRWYNADIQLGEVDLAANRIAGRFTTGSLSDLAAVFEWTFNLRVVRNGNTLTLYKK